MPKKSNNSKKSNKSKKSNTPKIGKLWNKTLQIPKSGKHIDRVISLAIFSKLEIIRETIREDVRTAAALTVDNMYLFLNKQRLGMLEKAYVRSMFDILSYAYMGRLNDILHESGIRTKKSKAKKGKIVQMGGGPLHVIYIIQFYVFALVLLNSSVSYASENKIVSAEVMRNIEPIRQMIESKTDMKPEEKTIVKYSMDNFLSNLDNISSMYLSTMPDQHGTIQFKNVIHKDDIKIIQEYITQLNKDIVELNSELKSVCVPLSKKFIQNDKDVLKMLSSAKYQKELRTQAASQSNMQYVSGFTQTNNELPLVQLLPTLENEMLESEENEYMNRQVKEFQQSMNDQYLQLLCERATPAPFYKFEAKPSMFSSKVNGFALYTRFRDPESLSMLASIVHGEISMLKEILKKKDVLMENENINNKEVLRYESLLERSKVFLGILTSATNFNIGQIEVEDAAMIDKVEPIFIKTQHAFQQYNKSIELMKKAFPQKEEELEEFRMYSEALGNMKDEETKQYIYEWFRPMKPYTQVAYETGEVIGTHVESAISNVSTSLYPALRWLEGLGVGIERMLYSTCLLLFLWWFGKPLGQMMTKKKSKTEKRRTPSKSSSSKTPPRRTKTKTPPASITPPKNFNASPVQQTNRTRRSRWDIKPLLQSQQQQAVRDATNLRSQLGFH